MLIGNSVNRLEQVLQIPADKRLTSSLFAWRDPAFLPGNAVNKYSWWSDSRHPVRELREYKSVPLSSQPYCGNYDQW